MTSAEQNAAIAALHAREQQLAQAAMDAIGCWAYHSLTGKEQRLVRRATDPAAAYADLLAWHSSKEAA